MPRMRSAGAAPSPRSSTETSGRFSMTDVDIACSLFYVSFSRTGKRFSRRDRVSLSAEPGRILVPEEPFQTCQVGAVRRQAPGPLFADLLEGGRTDEGPHEDA